MKKIFTLAILILLSFNPKMEAFAHSYVKESNPAEAEIVDEPLDRIIITFQTEIETIGKLSLIHNNNTVEVENIRIEDNELIGTFAQPLENGQYKATWKIVGEDGHPLEGTISFTVQVPDPSQDKSSNRGDETENQSENQANLEHNEKEGSMAQNEQINQDETVNITIKKWFLPLATLSILIMAIFLFRKGKK